MTNAAFESEMEKSCRCEKEVNPVMASQRFPAVLQSDWDQIRSTLNNLARVYNWRCWRSWSLPAAEGGRTRRTRAARQPRGAGGVAPAGARRVYRRFAVRQARQGHVGERRVRGAMRP